MNLEQLLIIGLGIWRLTKLIVEETGPLDVFLRIRQVVGISHDDVGSPSSAKPGYFSDLFSCVFCMSLNLSVIVFVIWLFFPAEVVLVITPFALGTLALVARRMTG